MKRISTLVKTLGVATTMMLLGLISVHAETFTVNTTADSGVGSLRQALADATLNGTANDIAFAIPFFDPGYDRISRHFVISVSTPLDMPVAATTIKNAQKQGITVRGDDTFTIFTLANSGVAVMNNITITQGFGLNGGGIYMGDSSTLTLNDCTISYNAATDFGGGIYMSSGGTVHANRTTFDSNTATDGAGIFVNGTANMDSSTMSGNSATGSGGAIFVETASALDATNTTFSSNFAGTDGGAILNAASITLTSNTITGNSATNGGGVCNFGAAAELNNSIVALNTATIGNDLLGDGVFGTAYTGTYNLIGNSDDSAGLNTATNMWGSTGSLLDPAIGELKDNGGATATHELFFDSPALDQGNTGGLMTDQRGEPRQIFSTIRSAGDGSDIGAFELQLGPWVKSLDSVIADPCPAAKGTRDMKCVN